MNKSCHIIKSSKATTKNIFFGKNGPFLESPLHSNLLFEHAVVRELLQQLFYYDFYLPTYFWFLKNHCKLSQLLIHSHRLVKIASCKIFLMYLCILIFGMRQLRFMKSQFFKLIFVICSLSNSKSQCIETLTFMNQSASQTCKFISNRIISILPVFYYC